MDIIIIITNVLIAVAVLVVVVFLLTKIVKWYKYAKALRTQSDLDTIQRAILVPLEEDMAAMYVRLSEGVTDKIKQNIDYAIDLHLDEFHPVFGKSKGIESLSILFPPAATTVTESTKEIKKDRFLKLLRPIEITAELSKTVVGQDTAKKSLSVAVANHCKRINYNMIHTVPIKKSNIILIGPTGSGKTLVAHSVADLLNVPFVAADCTQYTSAGWHGKDVTEILEALIAKAGSVYEAERGVIFLDEIDKVVVRDGNAHHGFNIQRDLLSVIEGSVVAVSKNVSINTKDILFILGGAFVDIKEQIQAKTQEGSGMGFNGTIRSEKDQKKKQLREITSLDLIDYGMMPEFVGRVPSIVVLMELTEKELVRVLIEPEDSIIQEYINLFEFDQVKLLFEPPALKAIAHHAILKKTGARSLRTILDRVMRDTMYNLGDDKRIYKVVVSKRMVEKALKEKN